MKSNHQIYEDLLLTYTESEVADFAMLPDSVSEADSDAARAEFAALRLQRRADMSEEERLLSALLGLKYQIRAYTAGDVFDASQSFANTLLAYLGLVNRNQKQFAADIDIHPSRLNRILKGKERIGKHLAFRLEKHSGYTIPAIYWWKLVQKEVEQEILTDAAVCESEQSRVSYTAYTVS